MAGLSRCARFAPAAAAAASCCVPSIDFPGGAIISLIAAVICRKFQMLEGLGVKGRMINVNPKISYMLPKILGNTTAADKEL